MAWKDQLRPASFRGVPFRVESAEGSTGRMAQQHEFANRDKPFSEDIGRKGRSYNVDAYIVDQDYFALRDALITACEKEGPGELIHPYLGQIQVLCTDCKFRETKKDGAFVQFSLTFIEAGEEIFPNESTDAIFNVNNASDNVIAKSKESFLDSYDVLKKPQFVIASAQAKVNDFADQVEKQSKSYSNTSAQITDLALNIKKLKGSINQIITTPDQLAEQMASAMSLLSQASNSPKEIYEKTKGLFRFGNADVIITLVTPSRVAQNKNSIALNQMIKQISFAETMRAAVQIPLVSTEDAKTLRQEILGFLDEQMAETPSDDVYQAQQGLLAALIQAIPSDEESLRDVSTLNLNETVPSLVLAHDLYDSVELEGDIIERNAVAHPGFMPSGKDLEVLQGE